ncbi:MAG: hypothetical protein JO159_07740 [Acidobacteria bacterium]|nr:hypothetical protein [Acidobacteriota bacterium]MBV9623404.1 hypothetical protein [Acidobacteriota bacterium]
MAVQPGGNQKWVLLVRQQDDRRSNSLARMMGIYLVCRLVIVVTTCDLKT